MENFSASRTTHINFFFSISQQRNKSLQVTITLYFLPIVLRTTTKHTFIPFYVWSPDWKMMQNCVCRMGHSSTESPKS